MHLREGSRALDIGCGTGLNFPLLLEVAQHKTIDTPPGNVALVEADAEQLDQLTRGLDDSGATLDAVLFTYSLSLMGNWEAAWRRATSLVRPGGRAGIVDMGCPTAGPGCSIRPPVWPASWVEQVSTRVR